MGDPGVKPLRVALGERSYPIRFAADGLRGLPDAIARILPAGPIAIVTNATVGRRYLPSVRDGLRARGFAPVVVSVPDGERAKTLRVAEAVIGRMLAAGLDRTSAIVALGGGVVGDLAGFVAAIFLRGVPYVQVPTTLLAQVDSSVGGKTGVNHARGKNLIGAFHQPSLVYADLSTLRTLEPRELRAGMAEVIKVGVIRDARLFARLEREMPRLLRVEVPALAPIVRRCCEIKAEVVAADEREAGLRAILNFGHTFGHAIENLTGYHRHKHGEAVAMGMVLAARLSRRMGLCDGGTVTRIEHLIHRAGLPVEAPAFRRDAWRRAVLTDKKRRADRIHFVAVTGIGRVRIELMRVTDLLAALDRERESR
jgi:3-dehydroquinate synthase